MARVINVNQCGGRKQQAQPPDVRDDPMWAFFERAQALYNPERVTEKLRDFFAEDSLTVEAGEQNENGQGRREERRDSP